MDLPVNVELAMASKFEARTAEHTLPQYLNFLSREGLNTILCATSLIRDGVD